MNRRPMFLLLLAALLLRGLLPLGYMPGALGGGALLAFCTPSGAQQRFVTDAELPVAGEHADCPYGFALSMGALLPDAAAVVAFAGVQQPVLSHSPLSPRTVTGPPYPARGPPLLV